MTPQRLECHVTDECGSSVSSSTDVKPTVNREWKIWWRSVVFFSVLHVAAAHSLKIMLFEAMWTTVVYTFVMGYFTALGITAGNHRLWSHRSFKARKPLQILLLYLQTMGLQNSVIHWVRDHRLHHKYSETDADPHNSTRGFFFAHIGWLLIEKHPEVKAKGKAIDMSDITEDPLLSFQHRYYMILGPLACFVIPAYIPTLWGETAWNSFFAASIFRYVLYLQLSCLVNSAAHLWGRTRPYDDNIHPVEIKLLSALTSGEGFHNYHHTFPWDYKAAELGDYSLNMTTMFIDLMAKIGWAYDLKTVPDDVVYRRALRTGDGSYQSPH